MGLPETCAQARDRFHGQPGRLRRLLRFRALPMDRRQRDDHYRQHRRHHAQLELSRADEQGWLAAGNLQERQAQGYAER